MSDPTRQLLEEEENRVPHVYPDPFGYMTIGVGHLVDGRKNGHLDDDVIDLQLTLDINKATAGLVRLIGDPAYARLNACQRAAVISMAFQLGTTGLDQFQDFLHALVRSDYKSAAAAGRASLWDRQTHRRAEREMKILESGVWVPKEAT